MAITTEHPRQTTTGLLRDQVRHQLRLFVREPVGAFLSIVFPIVFLVVFAGLYGDELLVDGAWLGPNETSADGVRYIQFAVPAMAVFATAMSSYVNLATATAAERGDGTLKRLYTTPLPLGFYLAGRIIAAVTISAVTTVVLVVVGVAAYDFDVVWAQVPAAVTTLLVGAFAGASLAMALVALVRPSAVQATAFASLLTLAFLSEIFLFGDRLPTVLSVVGWLFPLRHFSVALAGTAQPDTAAAAFAWDHLLVIGAWGIAAVSVAVRWFAWDTQGETRRRRSNRAEQTRTKGHLSWNRSS